ncbi:M56 family metallopeptidase [Nannocystis sp. ILAH1]|uniref:M56 family metallopeptidase n=1 Tax=Nannocystis sp. ILAH1 TaxID=2996789 RepID=UPI00226E1AF9|nr:M56 family metallopeptidase [Nannocystis sp. ILAH1]
MTAALAWLGVVVLHATWLGVATAAVAAIALRWLGVDRPRRRHGVALAALLIVPPAAIAVTLAPPPLAATIAGAGETTQTAPPLAAQARVPAAGEARLSLAPATPWIGLAWLLGAAWGALGLAVASGRVERLRRAARPLAVDDAERLLARARRHLDFHRPVAMARSSAVGVPTLIGWWRPLVVLPSALLDRVPDEELECLLIHELAHVQRADVAWNWLQVLVEVALFFHPAARWLAQQVRHERECCCDAVVPPRQADLVAYVRALTRLAAADRAAASPALSASGGTLVNRIERLVDPTAARPTCSLGLCFTLVLGAVAGGATLWLCDVEECPVPLEVEASAEQQLAAAMPAAPARAPLKFIDHEGNEVSPNGPDGQPRAFGFFTDEHGQDFAVLLGPDKAPPRKRPEAPIPFLDLPDDGTDDPGAGTDGC